LKRRTAFLIEHAASFERVDDPRSDEARRAAGFWPQIGRLLIVCFCCCATGGAALAQQQQSIGSTALTHNQVTRELAGATAPLNAGDPVFRNEAVRTASESTAKLVFLDSTNLAVGPTSRVVLDRFVFDASPSSQAVGVNLAKGVFRFTTGVLDKGAYSINTPTAAIGVRGTVIDIAVASGRTRVTLVEGDALVCPRRKGEAFEQLARDCTKGATGQHCDCVILDHNGQTASVKGGRAAAASDAVQFASLCAGSSSLCSSNSSTTAAAGILCGR
jgi:hypothetical protein